MWKAVGGAAICLASVSAVFPTTATSGTTVVHENAAVIPRAAMAEDGVGFSTAISGDTVVVGAWGDDRQGAVDAGSAHVFVRDGDGWREQATLVSPEPVTYHYFGVSVAISGDTAVVGSLGGNIGQPSEAFVFVRRGERWYLQARLRASDGELGDDFGYSVAISGDTLVVGAFGDDHGAGYAAGAAYVFVREGHRWFEEAKLVASDTSNFDHFGFSVAVAGETVIVGAMRDSHAAGSFAGSAYVFVRDGKSWSEQAKLIASDAEPNDQIGNSVAIDGDTLLIGAFHDDHATAGEEVGSAYVFVREGQSWFQQAKLTASDAVLYDQFGSSVAILGDTAVVGAWHDGHDDAGSAYVFVRRGRDWSERVKLAASDGGLYHHFGWAVGVSGDTAVVGAANAGPVDDAQDPDDDDSDDVDVGTGAVYVFQLGPAGTR